MVISPIFPVLSARPWHLTVLSDVSLRNIAGGETLAVGAASMVDCEQMRGLASPTENSFPDKLSVGRVGRVICHMECLRDA